MVSTPNGKDMLYYNTYRLALAKENNFIAVQFRWYQDPRYNKNLKWFKKNKNTGELDWIIEPTIDKTGTVVIPCKWKDARSFSEGLAWVLDNNDWRHIINKQGQIVK
jgi:hypothetical protein